MHFNENISEEPADENGAVSYTADHYALKTSYRDGLLEAARSNKEEWIARAIKQESEGNEKYGAEKKLEELNGVVGAMLGGSARETAALQVSRFMQLQVQAASLSDEQAMEVADLYEEWMPNKAYEADKILKYGKNANGETQLYRVIQNHTSQADWLPDQTASLYKAIGFDASGVPIWTQPLGAHDAWNKGDEVSHKGKLWISDIDANTYEPGVYGWTEKKDEKKR